METLNQQSPKPVKQNPLKTFFDDIIKKVSSLFEPEEVEVTFKEEKGKVVSYKYTKVDRKQVA